MPGRDGGIRQHFHPAAAGPVQLLQGEEGKENPAADAPGQSGVSQKLGGHGVGLCRLVEQEAGQGREDCGQGGEPGKRALQEPEKLQTEQADKFHRATSLEIR